MMIKPMKGKDGQPLQVRDIRTGQPLATDKYTEVRSSAYWLRRLRDGDVELKQATSAKAVAKTTAKAKS